MVIASKWFKMAEEWTKDQQDQITSLYGQLEGPYERKAHQKLFSGSQLPYLEAFNTLTNLVDEQKKGGSSGLEAKANSGQSKESSSSRLSLPTLTRPRAAFGLATIVLALAAAYTLGPAAAYALPLY